MPPSRPHSIALSLVLHVGLLGLAAQSSSQTLPRAPLPRRAALETIAIEAADALPHAGVASTGQPSEPGDTSAPVPASAAEAPVVRHPPRERAARPARVAEHAPEIVQKPRATPAAVAAPAPAEPQRAVVRSPSSSGAAANGAEASSTNARSLAGGVVTTGAAAGSGAGATTAGAPGSTPSADAQAALLARYKERLRARVEQHRDYPYLARRANLEGKVCLRVTIAASGSVVGVTPTCGASHELLLQAALKSVASAAPFPPLPAGFGARQTFDVPVLFRLDSL